MIFHRNALSHRIFARPKGSCDGLAHDYHTGSSLVIAFSELTSPQQADSHSPKVTGASTGFVHDETPRPEAPFHLEIAHCQSVAKRQPIHRTGNNSPGQTGKLCECARVKGLHLTRCAMGRIFEVDSQGHHALRHKTGVYGSKPQKALQHQTGASE